MNVLASRAMARLGLLCTAVAVWAGPLAALAAAADEEHGVPNPLSVDPDLAIFTAIVFVVLLIVLGKFAWGPIAAGLEKREHTIAEHIAAAERLQAEGQRLLAEHEKKLAGASDEVRALLDEGRRDAERHKQQIVTEAKSAAQAERDRGVHEIELATDKALRELAESSATLAVELAGKIVHAKLNPADHAKLIQESLGQLQKAAPSKN